MDNALRGYADLQRKAYIFISNPPPEQVKRMLLSQNTDCDRRIRHDYYRTGLTIPSVEKLRYKCRRFRYAAPVVWNRLPRSIRESFCIDTLKTRQYILVDSLQNIFESCK